MGKALALKALVGSQNYRLHHQGSDKDYKVYVFMTFHELFMREKYQDLQANEFGGEDEYKDFHAFPEMLDKQNPAALEVLFSTELELAVNPHLRQLFEMRDDLVRMNLPRMFASCMGSAKEREKRVTRRRPSTEELFDLYGYDTKSVMHGYRYYDFVVRFAKSNFTDFAGAMTYNDEEREFLLKVRHGELTEEAALALLKEKEQEAVAVKDLYQSQEVNEETRKRMWHLATEAMRHELLASW